MDTVTFIGSIGLVSFLIGLFCLIKPDNFLLPYLPFYYNKKHPFKPITYVGGLGGKHIKEFGKTKGLLLCMRITGAAFALVGILFLLLSFGLLQ